MARSDFNTKNEELKAAKAALKERDGQLEALKKTAGNTEELTGGALPPSRLRRATSLREGGLRDVSRSGRFSLTH